MSDFTKLCFFSEILCDQGCFSPVDFRRKGFGRAEGCEDDGKDMVHVDHLYVLALRALHQKNKVTLGKYKWRRCIDVGAPQGGKELGQDTSATQQSIRLKK